MSNREHDLDRGEVISTDGFSPLAELFIFAPAHRPSNGPEGTKADLSDERVVSQLREGFGRLPRELFRAWHRHERTGQVVAALGGLTVIVGIVEFKVRGGQDALNFIDRLHKAKQNFKKGKI